jgi:hypothetical protein
MKLTSSIRLPSFDCFAAAWDGNAHWLFTTTRWPSVTRGLWRASPGEAFRCIGSGIALFDGQLPRETFLVATAPGELHLFTADAESGATGHAIFDGARFVAQPPPPAPLLSVSARGAVGADPERRALLLASSAGELHEWQSGSWRRVGQLELGEHDLVTAIGWDTARRALVVVHVQERWRTLTVARSWDGQQLGELPAPRFEAFERRGLPNGAPDPVSGGVMFVSRVRPWVLGEEDWECLEGDEDPAIQSIGDVTGGKGTVDLWQATLTRAGGTYRRLSRRGEAWTREEGPPEPVYSIYDLGCGTLSHSDSVTWTELAQDGPRLNGAAVVGDAAGERVLAIGGTLDGKPVRETHEWTKRGGWKKLAPKGKPEARIEGKAFLHRSDVVVRAGTVPKKHVPNQVVDHFDGKRWTSYDEVFEGEPGTSLRLCAVDAESGVMFGVDREETPRLWIYRGAGVWTLVTPISVDLPGAPALSDPRWRHDAAARRLVAFSTLADEAGTAGAFSADLVPYLVEPEGAVACPKVKVKQVVVKRPAFGVKITAKPNGHRVGGPSPVEVPACESCGKEMLFLALFEATPDKLDLGDAAALAIFQCGEPTCPTHDPNAGANAAVLLEEKPKAKAGKGATFGAAKVEKQSDEPKEGSKLGGFPAWVQDDETPACATCGERMRFLLQLDADDIGANFGDVGVGYTFLCHGAKFLWQCA